MVAETHKIEAMVVVKLLRGVEVRFGGEAPQGWLPAGASRPAPTPVHVVKLDFEIIDDGAGFVLAWTGPSQDYCNDTWHETVDAALEDARLRFGIEPGEWTPPGHEPVNMSAPDRIKAILRRLQTVLTRHGERGAANAVSAALGGSDAELTRFLVSNELWGGSGSIADQAGVGVDRTARNVIEPVLADLGEEQIRLGKVNVRTEMWVGAFRKWQRDGI
jgi:hypothetical protein